MVAASQVKKIDFFAEKRFYLIKDIFDFSADILYKIEIFDRFSFKLVEEGTLTVDNVCEDEGAQYPENALQINLQRGRYAIRCENTEYMISKKSEPLGDMLEFKIQKGENLYIWQKLPRKARFKIYKITESKGKDLASSTIFKLNQDSKLYFPKYPALYEIVISRIDENTTSDRAPKYPHGTYELVFSSEAGSFKDQSDLERKIPLDLKKFQIVDGKIKSLWNINIPRDIDPINHYCFLGKLELVLYADFNNDKCYFIPNGYAEAFANLFVPERTFEVAESNNDYAIIYITDYKILSNSFMSHEANMRNISTWLGCDYSFINNENELYYYVDILNFSKYQYDKYQDILEQFFIYVDLDVKARVDDDLSEKIEDPGIVLPYGITSCRWRYRASKSKIYNKVEWIYTDDWKNTDDIINKINLELDGKAVLRITKRHLMNLTGLEDISEGSSGELTAEQFEELGLNGPEVNPFDRLQNFMQFKPANNK